jgi:hypothetical protein
MYLHLLNIEQVTPIHALTMHSPFLYWYKPDLKCEYHSDALGHSIETCITFKKKVLQLIKAR